MDALRRSGQFVFIQQGPPASVCVSHQVYLPLESSKADLRVVGLCGRHSRHELTVSGCKRGGTQQVLAMWNGCGSPIFRPVPCAALRGCSMEAEGLL